MNPAHDYIYRSPEPYRSIMLHLQSLIESTIPEAQLNYKWHLPFYYLDEKKMFCFLNFRKKFVDLGMSNGNELTNQHGKLVAGEGRKMLRSLRFESLEEMDDQVVIETLLELKEIRLNHKKKK